MPFGSFYVFEHFVVGEIREGAHFDWQQANEIILAVHEFFGTTRTDLSYISNRINSYSVTPQDWLKFYTERYSIQKVAIVGYSKKGFLSVALEKWFSKANYQSFLNLEEAIAWVSDREVITH